MTRKNTGREDAAGGSYLNDPKSLTAALTGYFQNITMDAHVSPSAVTNVTPDSITVARFVNADKIRATGDHTEPEALWNIYTTALNNNQLDERINEPRVFADHKGCSDCRTVVHDPEHTTEECPTCDAPMNVVSVPRGMTIAQEIEFPESLTPIMSDDDLQAALRVVFNTTDLQL